ncbi:hypothetical protein MTO96_029223 [Rhipicephalus appendiculatus]
MQGSFQDPLYDKEEAMGGQAANGRGRAEGEGGRRTNEQIGRESRKIQEPVEAPERSRGRAGSFPRLPQRQAGEQQLMTSPVTEATSGGAVLNSGRPTSPRRKVGWGERASQDKRDEEMFTIKEENRMLKEQLAVMSRQIEELKVAIKSANTPPVCQPQMPQKPNVEGSQE